MPRCYLSQLSEVEVGSAANFQLAGGSIQVESTRHDLRSCAVQERIGALEPEDNS